MITFFLLSLGTAAVLQLVTLKEAGVAAPPACLLFDALVLFFAGMALLFVTVWLADGPADRRARARAFTGEVERAAFRRRLPGTSRKEVGVKRDV